MAKKQNKQQKKTRLQALMEQEYVRTSCIDCKINVIVPKEKGDRCGACKSANISTEVWE